MRRYHLKMNDTPHAISIIFPVKNEGDNVKTTLDSLFSVKTNTNFEAIIVDDRSIDGCCDFIDSYPDKDKIKLITTDGVGPANARNIGADNASGDFLIFCDAHLTFEDWWIDRLLEPILLNKTDVVTPGIASQEHPDSVGYGMTLSQYLVGRWNTKENALFDTPIVPGGCFIISKEIFREVEGFEEGFTSWGYEDMELSIKLWLFGYRCSVEPAVKVLHLFRSKHPYEVDYSGVYYNLLRMGYLHFNENRILKCKQLITVRSPNDIEKNVIKDGVEEKRASYSKKRKFDDNWFFQKFNIPF
jgi:glycosyltransferase involved in cell wall biosynthesis